VKSGNSDVSVRSIPLAQYKDISDKFKEIEWDYSIDREELIRAFTYVLNFAAEKESHPELSQITIRNSTVFGGDVYQVGIYQSPAIDPEINLSIAVPLVPRLLKAIKMMKDSKVSFSVKDKVLVVGEDGFHVSFRVPSADPAELNKLLDQPFPTEVEVDRQYLDNAVRLVSTTLDTGSEQRIEFNFPKAKTEEQQNMHVQVEVNGRKSEDQLPVRYDQEGDKPVGFKLNYKDMLGVIAAIKLNVIGIAYHPEMKMVRFYEVDEESGQSTYSFLATLQRTEDAKPKSEKSADDGETADATAEVADPAPKAD
jgi:DNA polymerase III sliding clamp (beta) subunit (PCNA family)